MLPPTLITDPDFHWYFFQSPDPGHELGQAGTLPFPETYGNHFSDTIPVYYT